MLRLCAIAALVVIMSSALRGQKTDSTRLPRVVITATRLDTRLGSNIASVTVLDADTLRARGVRDIAEALREVPGTAVVRSGGLGAQTSLFLRGGESDYVRVLIDGVPMNDPGGSIDLASFTLENVDRIEVVRGPASVLYGSDAVAGVIQIFTRRSGTPLSATGTVSAGTYRTRAADVTLGAAARRFDVTVAAARRTSDGILQLNNGYESNVLSARAALGIGGGFRAAISGRQHDDEYHYPTDGAGRIVDVNAFRSDRRSALAFDAQQQLGALVNVQLGLAAMEGRPRTHDPSDGTSDTLGFYAYRAAGSVRRRVADARINVLLPGSAIATLGHEWQRESQRGRDSSNFDSAPNAFGARRITRATFVQLVGERGPVSYTIGGRYDDNDVFGSFRTARAGLALRAGGGTTLRVNAGSAFKAPTFLEQFNTAFSVGNRELAPERSRSIEFAVQQQIGLHSELTATYFAQRFRELIQYSFIDAETPNYFNIAAASAHGVEIEARARVYDATQITGTVTFLRTRVDDAGFDRGSGAIFVKGERLLRRPSVSGSLVATSRLTTHLAADARLLFVGSRDDRDFAAFPATPIEMEAYQRLDAGLAYDLGSVPLTVFGRADNLLNDSYQEIANFPAPGRGFTVGLRVQSR